MAEQSNKTTEFAAAELARSDDLPRIVPGDAERGEVQLLSERLVWKNDTARFFVDHVRYPGKRDGSPVEADVYRLGDAPGKANGVITVPVTADDRIILVRQFRHPVRMWTLELPRGGREEGESPEEAARREIHEEIGYEVDAMQSLGRVAADSGQLSSIPHIIVARVHRSGAPEREETETIDRMVSMPYPVLRAACERGEILDGYTLSAVLRLSPLVQGGGIRIGDDSPG